jgi:hypothetical protein
MDELDNFDFKPLTTGLGFDKKAEQAKVQKKTFIETPKISADTVIEESLPSMSFKETKSTTPDLFERSLEKDKVEESSRTIKDMLNALPPSLDFADKATSTIPSRNYSPVGRAEYVTPAYDKPKMPLDAKGEIATDLLKNNMDISLDNTLEKAFPKVGFRKPFFHQTVEIKPQFTPVTASFTSGVIDALVIGGLTALFLVCLVMVTQVDLIAVILHTQAPLSVWLEVGAIFLGVYCVYYMWTRSYWGSSLGDWAFDMQLGLETDRLKASYPFIVIARMIFIACTGFVILPLISFIAKKDILGSITGVGLYSKNY